MGAVGKVLTRSPSVALDPIRELEVFVRKLEELKDLVGSFSEKLFSPNWRKLDARLMHLINTLGRIRPGDEVGARQRSDLLRAILESCTLLDKPSERPSAQGEDP